MTDDDTNPQLLDALPATPLSNDAIKELGESDRTIGTRPLSSRFNDFVTEFLLIGDSGTHAIAFDPENETWSVLEHRPHDDMRDLEVRHSLNAPLVARVAVTPALRPDWTNGSMREDTICVGTYVCTSTNCIDRVQLLFELAYTGTRTDQTGSTGFWRT